MYEGVYNNPHIMQTQYHPHGMAGINPNVSIYKQPKIAKKVSHKSPIGLSQSPPGLPPNGLFANMQQPNLI